MGARRPIPQVLDQHAEDAVMLRHCRSVHVRAPHVHLHHLQRLDERLAAHLDGLHVAAAEGLRTCLRLLDDPGAGAVFVAAVCVLQAQSASGLQHLLRLAQAVPEAEAGLVSALGWVEPTRLLGWAQPLLDSPDPWHLRIGLAACAAHRVDPGAALDAALASPDAALRRRALRTAGVCGRIDLREAVVARLAPTDDMHERFEAARAALLLGATRPAVHSLLSVAQSPVPQAGAAFLLALQALPVGEAQSLVSARAPQAAGDDSELRLLIQACASVGCPSSVPWLLELMARPTHARLAGEAFTLITGADLEALDLEQKPPDDLDLGPSDQPDDNTVALDEDESLPWPDAQRAAAWWQANAARFAIGQRHLMGAPPTWEQALHVLRSGGQRQRWLAALHLCLLRPGLRLFNGAAPAARQLRSLSGVA
jgi:uncharacterized protein (TIGR02270 family)